MLTQEEIIQIRKLLKRAKTPFYFFDADPDGLCSFLLLMKKYEKGDFECVQAPPDEEYPYLKKAEEIYSDLIVILDRPSLTQKAIDAFGTEVLWIDHHPPIKRKNVFYFNSRLRGSSVPTSYMAYRISQRDMWISAVGSIADHHLPNFLDNFSERYPVLLPKKIRNIDKILYETELGLLTRIFSFNLLGSENEVRKSVNYLLGVKEPYEILNRETIGGRFLYKKYEKMNKKYQKLLGTALKEEGAKFMLFTYQGKTSFTGELSNELLYRKKPEFVIVAKEPKDSDSISMSIRSKRTNLHPLMEKALRGLRGSGGGHEYACGAHIKKKDFGAFINNFQDLIE